MKGHEPHGDRPQICGTRVCLKTERNCKCGSDIAIIGQGSEPHAAELRCERCDSHRGWLSQRTANWISTVMSKFGAPTTPIILRGKRASARKRGTDRRKTPAQTKGINDE